MEQAKDRLTKLKLQLSQYAYEYYVLDKPSMDDAVYDGLMTELKQIETQYPELITIDSPSQRVGGALLEGFKSVAHQSRMLSLNDVFDETEIDAWIKRISKLIPDTQLDFFSDVKKDGLACSLVYQNGLLKQAVTRGDGFEGEDVTSNVRTIRSVPLSLRMATSTDTFLQGRTEVRGEIVMYKRDFEKLNNARAQAGQPLFANPRNTAAGTIRQLDPGLVAERSLHFLAYDLQIENSSLLKTHVQVYEALKELGFGGSEYAKELPDVASIHSYAAYWGENRHNLPYNIDGLVIKINDRQRYSQLGVVGKNPRGAVAYKYPAEQSTTKVKDIFVSIGRTGAATPVALLEPVVIAGSTVQMATLHNESEVQRKDVRIGDTVIVRKAGDVIPEIVEPIISLRSGTEKRFFMPKSCPECDTALVKIKVEDAVWRCPNNKCPSRVQNQIQHFASKGALDIEGMGEKNVVALLQAGLIHTAADLYKVTKEQLLDLDRFADISASKLVQAIADKKHPPLSKFIFALGIRHVGAQTAIDLANRYKRLDNLGTASYQELREVEGVGEVVAESVIFWFSDDENQKLLANFRSTGVWPEEVKTIGGALAGKKFVITGTLETMGRDQAADSIRAKGGTFQSSLGKDTDFLVVGKNVGASKLTKAEKIGTKQISEKALVDLLK